MKFRFKHGYDICSVEDAIGCVKDTGSQSWSEFVTHYPEASTVVIELEFKEAVMASFGWTPLVNYSGKSDDELLATAIDTFRANQFTTMNQLGIEYSSLISNVRSRGLVDRLYDALGLEKPFEWQGMSLDDLIAVVRRNAHTSFSNWHNESSGSYKYAASRDWVREVGKALGWGDYKGLNGYSYASLPETIVANLLHMAKYDFANHPRITHFSGYGGGQPFGDFLLEGDLWVEVWAYRTDETPAGIFERYPEVRRHKEGAYAANGMRLCGIEGGLFYRKQTIDGTSYAAGLSSFVRHACQRLSDENYAIEYTADLLSAVRNSIVDQSESAMIER
ncbi:hypothetical protein D0T25_05555 [Duganella sp. BJB488]|nr:hypothetical protein D0T26_05595 [Duganella sp. BJB489]RFP26841.1 hypothetical protein D0T25_05555 [Duganella sp. BJB488]RFP34427.1 hypothetical protein D0T24_12475 [Duganella sp. BJB480]